MNFVHRRHPNPLLHALRRLPQSGLLVLTSVSSLDGTIAMLAATGMLSSVPGALVAGVTVIAGVGSWLAARDEFTGRLRAEDGFRLALILLLASSAAAAAAWVGATVAATQIHLRVLPRASGLVLLLLALEVGGVRLPRLWGRLAPAPLVVLGALALEGVLLAWNP